MKDNTEIRENIFSALCDLKKVEYSVIYDMWLNN